MSETRSEEEKQQAAREFRERLKKNLESRKERLLSRRQTVASETKERSEALQQSVQEALEQRAREVRERVQEARQFEDRAQKAREKAELRRRRKVAKAYRQSCAFEENKKRVEAGRIKHLEHYELEMLAKTKNTQHRQEQEHKRLTVALEVPPSNYKQYRELLGQRRARRQSGYKSLLGYTGDVSCGEATPTSNSRLSN
jgi:hypothetical protein